MKGVITVLAAGTLFCVWTATWFMLGEDYGRDNAVLRFEQQHEGCRYWNVLTPANEIGDQFWIGGWTKDCGDGMLEPVIEFGSEEEAVEVLSRMENFIAIRETEWNNAQ